MIYDEAISSFFRNVESAKSKVAGNNEKYQKDLPVGSMLNDLKARAIVVDMENQVVNNKVLNGDLRDIFDAKQCISDQSGSGNNWARGHLEYGPLYKEEIEEKVR